MFHFDKKFIFGAATSAYQIEGAYNEDGKKDSNWDYFSRLENKIDRGDTGNTACDHYHRYKEDVELMKQIGLESYRFSVAWSRVIPDGFGKVNEKGVKFYSDLIDELIKSGIEPMITIFHWDTPQNLENYGGFLNEQIVEWYTDYAKLLFERFGSRVKKWVTFNEPFVYTHFGYVWGNFPPGRRDDMPAKLRAAHNLLKCHGSAVRLFRQMKTGGEIGITLDYAPNLPKDKNNPLDVEAAKSVNKYWAGWFYEAVVLGAYPKEAADYYKGKNWFYDIPKDEEKLIAEPIDFLGINNYFSNYVEYFEGGDPVKSRMAYLPFNKNDMGWDITPDGFYDLLMYFKQTCPYPVYITENGISLNDIVALDGTVKDYDRIDYMTRYIGAMERAIKDGADIRGYYYWSLMDNFEWAAGYKPRFGLIHVDYKTQKRTLKEAAKFYSQIIKEKNK